MTLQITLRRDINLYLNRMEKAVEQQNIEKFNKHKNLVKKNIKYVVSNSKKKSSFKFIYYSSAIRNQLFTKQAQSEIRLKTTHYHYTKSLQSFQDKNSVKSIVV